MPRLARTAFLALTLGLAAAPMARAQDWAQDEATLEFVDANMLATFYHELGHALIDTLQLPVLGREEDAADTLSTLLIHDLWQEDAAVAMVYHTAGAYYAYASEAQGYELAYWDEHSLDMQRYYNMICLFYGANPDEREDVAIELELPVDRAERCPDEFQLAYDSWGVMLEGLEPGAGKKGLVMEAGDGNDMLYSLIATEVAELNKSYGLPQDISVGVEPCGTANAFYSPDDKRITICTEYAEDLARVWQAAN